MEEFTTQSFVMLSHQSHLVTLILLLQEVPIIFIIATLRMNTLQEILETSSSELLKSTLALRKVLNFSERDLLEDLISTLMMLSQLVIMTGTATSPEMNSETFLRRTDFMPLIVNLQF